MTANTLFLLNVLYGLMSIFASYYLDTIIEWAVHRFPMHRKIKGPWPLFRYLLRKHVAEHHAECSGDNFHQEPTYPRSRIAFDIWVGPLLIATAVSPFALISWLTGNWIALWCSLAVAIYYYIMFEGLHQLMHLQDSPVVKFIRSSKWYKDLELHHWIHHERPGFNFGLVSTQADKYFGTYLSYERFCALGSK